MTATALNQGRSRYLLRWTALDAFTAACFVLAAILAAAMLGFASGQHHPQTSIPSAVQHALRGGYDCWLETDVDGSAQWYCGSPVDDNVFRPGIDNPATVG